MTTIAKGIIGPTASPTRAQCFEAPCYLNQYFPQSHCKALLPELAEVSCFATVTQCQRLIVWHNSVCVALAAVVLMLRAEETKWFQTIELYSKPRKNWSPLERGLRLCLSHEVIVFMVLAYFCMAPSSRGSSSMSHISCQPSCSATLSHGKQLEEQIVRNLSPDSSEKHRRQLLTAVNATAPLAHLQGNKASANHCSCVC